jgi:hypothetical protein
MAKTVKTIVDEVNANVQPTCGPQLTPLQRIYGLVVEAESGCSPRSRKTILKEIAKIARKSR